MAELLNELVERIRASGPIRFDDYVEAALYDPDHGFFAGGSGAGRAGGDFLTSPEVGPLFGALFARQLDRLWVEAGRPQSFHVVEVAAGRGALAIAVRAAAPECSAALNYHLVERSAELRDRQHDHLPIDAGSPSSGSPDGPTFRSHAALGELDSPVDVVFANELLDNIPFRVLERTLYGWGEVHVGLNDAVVPELREVVLPLDMDEMVDPLGTIVEWAESVAPDCPVGARVPLQLGALRWLEEALELVRSPGGAVIVIDYCRPTAQLARLEQSEWLRTYREHGRGVAPLADPGSQDITCDVALDQLADLAPWQFNQSQAEWLSDLGVVEMVEEGRRIWNESAGAPNLAAIRARSRISEADALCDKSGLGGFRVLSWRR